MRWFIFALLMLVPQVAFGAQPFARATVDTQGETVPGQQIRILVEVFAPDFFTSPPQFPLFDLPDALVTIPDERTQNVVQTIDGVEYAGIQRTYSVVPEKPGTYSLPSITIEFGYSVEGKPTNGSAFTNSISFNVSAGTEAGHGIAFAARDLTLTQSFDRDPDSLKKGEALVRTIIIFAEDTQAMMIPPAEVGAADGLTQYTKSPQIEDDVQVARLHGSSRMETVVYTADKVGSFVIPDVSYSWFDLDSRVLQTALLPAVKVTVATAPPTSDRIAPELLDTELKTTFATKSTIMAVGAIGLIVIFVWFLRRANIRLCDLVLNWMKRYKSIRAVRLRRLRSTIKTGDDLSIYLALQDWSRSLNYRSLAEWLVAQSSHRLRDEVAVLERRLFRSKDRELDRRTLARLVGAPSSKTQSSRRSRLPELNPL